MGKRAEATWLYAKKGALVAPQRDREDVVERRAEFTEGQKLLDFRHLVFVDESAISLWMTRNHAWSERGKPAVVKRPHHSKTLSIVGAIAFDGLRSSMCVEDSIDGEVFCIWLREGLVPTLNKGDLVVMDNLSVHKMVCVKEILAEVGASPLFLPPYSPDLNPIEMLWELAKSKLRSSTARSVDFMLEVLGRVFNGLSSDVILGWMRHCGYDTSTCST